MQRGFNITKEVDSVMLGKNSVNIVPGLTVDIFDSNDSELVCNYY